MGTIDCSNPVYAGIIFAHTSLISTTVYIVLPFFRFFPRPFFPDYPHMIGLTSIVYSLFLACINHLESIVWFLGYPLVKKHSYGKWPFIVIFPLKIVIFYSYVKLPEGNVANPRTNPQLTILTGAGRWAPPRSWLAGPGIWLAEAGEAFRELALQPVFLKNHGVSHGKLGWLPYGNFLMVI